MLVEQFPDDSALHAALRGGREHRPWTFDNHLLATIANLLHAGNRQRAGKRTRTPLVEPPKAKAKPARRLTVAELIARNPELAI